MSAEETARVVMLLPPAPPARPPLLVPPPAPSTSTWTEVTPAGGVQVPEPAVQVTVTVDVPDSLHVPVEFARAGADEAKKPTTTANAAAIVHHPARETKPRPSGPPIPILKNIPSVLTLVTSRSPPGLPATHPENGPLFTHQLLPDLQPPVNPTTRAVRGSQEPSWWSCGVTVQREPA